MRDQIPFVTREARLFRIADYPTKRLPDGTQITRDLLARVVPRAITNTNRIGAPTQIEHRQQQVFDLGGLVPGSLEQRGDEVWGEVRMLEPLWRQIADDPARKGLSVRLDLDQERFSEVSHTLDPVVKDAQLFADGGQPHGGGREIVFEEGEIMGGESTPKPGAETGAGEGLTEERVEGITTKVLRKLGLVKDESATPPTGELTPQPAFSQADVEAVVNAAVEEAVKAERELREAQFGRLQQTRIEERIQREIALGMTPEEASFAVPFAEGQMEVTFGEGEQAQQLGVRDLAERFIEARRGTVPMRALFSVGAERPDEGSGNEAAVLAKAAEFEKAGMKRADALDRAIREG